MEKIEKSTAIFMRHFPPENRGLPKSDSASLGSPTGATLCLSSPPPPPESMRVLRSRYDNWAKRAWRELFWEAATNEYINEDNQIVLFKRRHTSKRNL